MENKLEKELWSAVESMDVERIKKLVRQGNFSDEFLENAFIIFNKKCWRKKLEDSNLNIDITEHLLYQLAIHGIERFADRVDESSFEHYLQLINNTLKREI